MKELHDDKDINERKVLKIAILLLFINIYNFIIQKNIWKTIESEQQEEK